MNMIIKSCVLGFKCDISCKLFNLRVLNIIIIFISDLIKNGFCFIRFED